MKHDRYFTSGSLPRMVGLWLDAGRAFREGVGLAKAMHRRSYAKIAPNWEPLNTTSGVISQIDNMHAGTMDLLDWAESLLCNAAPMSHCTQEEWDTIIRKWRDQKHGISEPNEKAQQPHD
jgi:hypothetical protein